MDLYLHSAIRLHGVVLEYSGVTNLPFISSGNFVIDSKYVRFFLKITSVDFEMKHGLTDGHIRFPDYRPAFILWRWFKLRVNI